MARSYPKRRKDPPTKEMGTKGWALGLNQLTHPSVIKNNELAECFNAVFTQNGVLKKREGSLVVGNDRDGDSTVYALQSVYDIGGTDMIIRIGTTGIAQKFNQATQTFSDISGSPTFTEKRTSIIQGYGYVYFFNEDLVMAKWDGTTWTTFTALANPSSAPAAIKTGAGTGARKLYYKYVWFNATGHSIGSAASTVLTSMPDTLDTTTYVTVTVSAGPTGTINTAVFKGLEPGQERYLATLPGTDTVYLDKGQDFVDETYSVPTDNTTSGYHFKWANVFKDTIIGITTELGDDTLVYSGGLDQFDNFGISSGGGYYSWRKGDGAKIVAGHTFKEQFYVFKTNKTGVFDFSATSGAATVKDVNLAVGGVSQDAIHPAGNDLRGWGDDGAFSMGNEPSFADVIRTKVLSARADKTVSSITRSDINKITSIYYKNLSIWAIPTATVGSGNNIMLVYDERYVAWSIWTGMRASCFTKFKDSSNVNHLYYGDVGSGNMVEMFTGYNDVGSSVNFRISTKQFDAGAPHKYKTFNKVFLIFGVINGSGTTISLVENGAVSNNSYGISASNVNQGFGVDQWGTMQFGQSTTDTVTESTSLTVKYADIGNRDLFSMQVQMSNDGLNDQVELMSILFEYSDSEQPLPSTKKLTKLP
jgi:hypothetical protein